MSIQVGRSRLSQPSPCSLRKVGIPWMTKNQKKSAEEDISSINTHRLSKCVSEKLLKDANICFNKHGNAFQIPVLFRRKNLICTMLTRAIPTDRINSRRRNDAGVLAYWKERIKAMCSICLIHDASLPSQIIACDLVIKYLYYFPPYVITFSFRTIALKKTFWPIKYTQLWITAIHLTNI